MQCAGHTWQPVLTHTERAQPASAELTWNARLRAKGAGQVPEKINSTEPPGGNVGSFFVSLLSAK